MNKKLALCLVPVFLAGCLLLQPATLQPTDLKTAELLPTSAAAKILGKYIVGDMNGYSSLANKVNLVFYDRTYRFLALQTENSSLGLPLGKDSRGICLHKLSEENARQVYIALVSLGTSASYLQDIGGVLHLACPW